MGPVSQVIISGAVIAHRAGNDIGAIAPAAAYADVIEADVHLFRGRLEVRHAKTIGPLPVLWERWYLLPRATPRLLLGELLSAVPPDVDLMLDLKGPDPRLPEAVMRAVPGWQADGRRLVVCSRVWRTVDRLRGRPGVTTLHSAGSRRQIRALLRRYGPGTLEGVSVDCRLLTPQLVGRQARWQAQFGKDFDFWLPKNASEVKILPDRIRVVSQQRLDQLSR